MAGNDGRRAAPGQPGSVSGGGWHHLQQLDWPIYAAGARSAQCSHSLHLHLIGADPLKDQRTPHLALRTCIAQALK